jgi:tRNA(Leu) C34 or U34 (ribose-2'-O)-methylase TrmL
VKQKPVVRTGNIVRWDVLHKLQLDLVGCVGFRTDESKAMADTEYVGVNGHCGFAESYRLDDVSSLATNARQVEKLVHILWHFSIMTLYKHSCHLHQMIGFGVGIGNTLDIF